MALCNARQPYGESPLDLSLFVIVACEAAIALRYSARILGYWERNRLGRSSLSAFNRSLSGTPVFSSRSRSRRSSSAQRCRRGLSPTC
eukprot:3927025-Prymnesium_polylepis.2